MGRWERLYTDNGECLLDRATGMEVVIRKCYGYPAWGITVTRWKSGEKKRTIFADEGTPRRSRPTRSELAVLMDELVSSATMREP